MAKRRRFRRLLAGAEAPRHTHGTHDTWETVERAQAAPRPPVQPLPQRRPLAGRPPAAAPRPPAGDEDHLREITALLAYLRRDDPGAG
jgi:hypothetical protein